MTSDLLPGFEYEESLSSEKARQKIHSAIVRMRELLGWTPQVLADRLEISLDEYLLFEMHPLQGVQDLSFEDVLFYLKNHLERQNIDKKTHYGPPNKYRD
jgi:hypothetical protein